MALPYATVDQVYQIMRKKSDKTDTTTYVSTEKLNSFTKTGTGIEFSNSTHSSNNTKLTITTSKYGADFKLLTSQDSQYFPLLETDSMSGLLSASTIFGNFGTDTTLYAMGYSYNGIFFNRSTGSTEKFTGIFSHNNQSESLGTYAGILLTKDQEYYGCGEFTIIPWDEMCPAIVYYPSSTEVTPENRYEFQLPKKSGTFALTSDLSEVNDKKELILNKANKPVTKFVVNGGDDELMNVSNGTSGDGLDIEFNVSSTNVYDVKHLMFSLTKDTSTDMYGLDIIASSEVESTGGPWFLKGFGEIALKSDIPDITTKQSILYHHTITIKEGTKIIFAANRELESATAATTLETLISTFAGTTTAGFGDYILLTVDTAAKLTKQDGTETDLSTLTVTISDTVK